MKFQRLVLAFGLIFVASGTSSVARSKVVFVDQLRKAAIEERDSKRETVTPVKEKDENGTRFSVGPGAAILGKSVGFSGSVEISFKASSQEPLYFGFDLSYSLWGSDAGDASAALILSSLVYHFERARTATLHPYLGISSGIASVKTNPTIDLGIVRDSNPFVFLFRPGVESNALSEAFSVGIETKMGYVGPSFLFMPMVRLTSGF